MVLKHALGDIPMVRVLDFMLEHLGLDYTTKEIAEYAHVSPGAVKRDFGRLIECGMVTETRKIGVWQMYTLNIVDGVTDALVEFDDALNDYMSVEPADNGIRRVSETRDAEGQVVSADFEVTVPDDFDSRTILDEHNKYHVDDEEWTTGDEDETANLSPG